jgi:enoyl-CoA hydratase/carnithine racemase
MADYEKVLYERRGRTTIITLNRPDVMNAVDPQVSDELHHAWSTFRDDDDAWVAIMTGAGDRAFSAGNDLVAMARGEMHRVAFGGITRDFWCPKPMIAAINGYCLAGGLELALMCDIRIAAEHAVFGLPEVTRAIIPGAGGTQRLPRAIPFGQALELMLTGGKYDSGWALRNGLVNYVLPAEAVMPKALQIAEAICENGPLAVRAVKEAAYRGVGVPLDEGLRYEMEAWRTIGSSEDAREGPRAFAQKRKPDYKGR